MKLNKKIIVALCLVITVGIVILFFVFGHKNEQESEKLLLYKYNVEDINYMEIKLKLYEIEYSGKIEGLATTVSVGIRLEDGGSCYYYSTIKNAAGTTVISSDNCSYNIDYEMLTFDIRADMKNIYEPSNEYKKLGYSSETTIDKDIIIDGYFSDNGKHLTIRDFTFSCWEYNYYLENDIQYVLIDPNTNKDYRLDGTRDRGYEPEFLDLTKYQIIDGKEYIETNNDDTSDSSTDNNDYDVSMMQDVTLKELLNLFERNETKVVYMGRKTCEYCVMVLPTLQKAQKVYNYKTVYLDIETVNESLSYLKEFTKKLDLQYTMKSSSGTETKSFGEFYGTAPAIFIIKNGKMVDGFYGAISYEAFTEFLENNGFRK